jgi:hypothetical protein
MAKKGKGGKKKADKDSGTIREQAERQKKRSDPHKYKRRKDQGDDSIFNENASYSGNANDETDPEFDKMSLQDPLEPEDLEHPSQWVLDIIQAETRNQGADAM